MISNEDKLLLSRMFQSKNKIFEANNILNDFDGKDLSSDVYERKISLLVKQILNGNYLDEDKLREYLTSLSKKEKITSEKLKKILMVLTLNAELPQDIINLISNFNFTESDKSTKGNLQNIFLVEKFSQNKDLFNSLEIFLELSRIETLKN